MKSKAQLDGMPVWFDGKSINEALFCEEFLQTYKMSRQNVQKIWYKNVH